ncbi:MAG: acyltransferase [Bacteroidota bacterium]
MRGAKIGKGVSLGLGSVLIGDKIEIGEYTEVGFLVIVRAREIKLGRRVSIGATSVIDTEKIEIDDEAVVTEQVFIGGNPTPDSYFKLGKRSIVMYMSYLNPSKRLIIGDDTGIGGHCIIFTHGSWQSELDGYPVKYEDIIIGNNVWLPWRVFIMPGITIGDNTTIGANSLVTKDLPEGVLAAGNPAKILRTSEQYPPKMSKDDKIKVMDHVVNEYIRELEYHHLTVEVDKQTDYWLLTIQSGREKHILIYCINDCDAINNFSFHPNVALMTLTPIKANLKAKISNAKAMLLDLTTRERTGSSKAGEEIINTLRKRGITLIRSEYEK